MSFKKSILIPALASIALLQACSQNQQQADQENQTINQQEEQAENQQSQTAETIEKEYYIHPEVFSVHPIEQAPTNKILLTFDDAPNPHHPEGNTLKIAHSLKEAGAGAIFFVNGMYLEDEDSQKIVKELYDMGFEIGNHTETHPQLPDLSEEEQYQEIIATSDKVEDITGQRPRFFRPPHGMITDYALELCQQEGMQWTNWSYGYDWMPEYQDPQALTQISLSTEYLSDGANILMHDFEWTADALDQIIQGYQDQGYGFVDPRTIETNVQLESGE